MKLRKTRVPTQGVSNKDFRQINQDRPDDLEPIEFIAMPKPQNFQQILSEKISRKAPDPLKETKTFYEEIERKQLEKIQISQPRFGQLEEPELKKRVFNGESNIHLNPTHQQHTKLKTSFHNDSQIATEKLIDFKHEDYSKQIQETQLVGIKHNTESLKGEVDIQKVKEVRRALRRRYANRKNFQKIYSAWDVESQGRITPSNCYDMLIKLGIKANIHEARVLVASVDQDQNGHMGLDEFMDLIFNDSDNLNVDLEKIPIKGKIEQSEQQNFGKDIAQISQQTRELRHQNQLDMILKNKSIKLANLFRIEDEFNSGFISQERLNDILMKQNIPENIMRKEDQHFLFNKFKIDDYKFNYKEFVNHLNNFEFKQDDIYRDPRDIQKEQSQLQRQIRQFQDSEDQRIYVFNAEQVNGWHLERIRKDYRNVQRVMFRYVQTKDDFKKLFMQTHNLRSDNELKKMDINKKQLVQFIQNMFLTVGEEEIKKNEVENFLSVFQYNNHEYTKAGQIPDIIYEETDAEWYEKVQRQLNKPAPPDEKKFHEDYPLEKLEREKKFSSLHQKELVLSNNNLGTEGDEVPSQPIIDNRRTKTASLPLRRKKYLPNNELQPQGIQNIMKKIEDRIFCGSQKAYKIYQDFDQDKDGFVSHQDFVKKFKQIAILNDNEVTDFLNYVDPQHKGYVNFREFCDKVRDGSQYTDTNGLNSYIPGFLPSKEYIDSMKGVYPKVQKKVTMLQNFYKPDDTQLQKASRFQYTPMFKNTFTSVQPRINSPMYENSQDRFKQNHNHRTDWQKAELKKKYGYEEGRIQKKRQFYQNIEKNKNLSEDQFYKKQENMYKSKGILQWTYEHRAHVQNQWNGGGKALVDDIKEQKEKDSIKPPLFGKWTK